MTNFQFKTMISIDKIPTMWEVLTTFFPGFGFIEGSVMETDIRVFSECRWAGRVLGKTPRQVCHAFPRVLLSNLCYFHPYLRNPEEMIQIDEHKFYPTGLVQPPTSFILGCSPFWFPVINVFFLGDPYQASLPTVTGRGGIQVCAWHTFLHTPSNTACLHVLTFWQDVMFSRNELTLGTERRVPAANAVILFMDWCQL